MTGASRPPCAERGHMLPTRHPTTPSQIHQNHWRKLIPCHPIEPIEKIPEYAIKGDHLEKGHGTLVKNLQAKPAPP
eukprot:4743835-Karenia_brevis.AAC.1